MEPDAALVPRRRRGAAAVDVFGELVLAHPLAPGVVRLDPINARLWEAFGPDVTVEDLAQDAAAALEVDLAAARAKVHALVATLAEAGLLERDPRTADLTTVENAAESEGFGAIAAGSCAAQRFGFATSVAAGAGPVGLGADESVVVDLGPACLRVASTSPLVVAHLRHRFADRVLPASDPRIADPNLELVVAAIGGSRPAGRRPHRLLDHAAEVWFATFDLDEAVAALDRFLLDRIAMTEGGVWLRLPVLVPLGSSTGPALVLHPVLGRGLDRLLPPLRRAGIGTLGSPFLRVGPTPRLIALVGPAADLSVAEVVQWFAPGATTRDQVHLEAIAALAQDPGYVGLTATASLRATAAELVACFAART